MDSLSLNSHGPEAVGESVWSRSMRLVGVQGAGGKFFLGFSGCRGLRAVGFRGLGLSGGQGE